MFLWDVRPPEEGGMGWEGWSEEKMKVFEMITPRPGELMGRFKREKNGR